jgi:hypothetical protein
VATSYSGSVDQPVRVSVGDGGTIGLNQPGHRVNPTAMRDGREAAYAEYERTLCSVYIHDAAGTWRVVKDAFRVVLDKDG